LGAELSEVEIGTGAVSHVHGLHETTLRVEAVEDDAVEGDADDLDDYLDDDANESPVLKATNESVVDLVLVDFRTLVVGARPSPHVLVVAVVFAVLEDDGCDYPQKHT